jgi:hypothetical protein
MNIMFIGPYRQEDGWGIAARNYLYALSSEYNVTAKHIRLAGSPLYTDHILDKLESNKFESYDILIQKSLPKFWIYDDRFKLNIGIIATETVGQDFDNFNFDIVDKILVSSKYEAYDLKKANPSCKDKIYNVGLPFHVTKTSNTSIISESIPKDSFVFYFIGEWSERKSVKEMIIAYLSEFNTNEDNVALMIKSNVPGLNPDQSHQVISKQINEIRSSLRLYNNQDYYPQISLTTSFLTQEQIQELHQASHCYVNLSKGEANCLPAYSAYLNNNWVINTDGISTNWCMPNNCERVSSVLDTTFCTNPPIPSVYTANEKWFIPNIDSAKHIMRKLYNKGKCESVPDITMLSEEYFLSRFDRIINESNI